MPETDDSPVMSTITPSAEWQEGDEMYVGIYTIIRFDRHNQVAQDELIIGTGGHGDRYETILMFYLNNQRRGSSLHQVSLNRETGRIAWPSEGNPWSAEFICERVWSGPALHVGPSEHSGGVDSFEGTWGDGIGEKSLVGVRHLVSERLKFPDFEGVYALERDGDQDSVELSISRNGNVHYDGKRLEEVTVDPDELRLTWPVQDACPFSAEVTLKEVVCASDRVYRCALEGASRQRKVSEPKNLSGVRDDFKTLIRKFFGYYACSADFLLDSLSQRFGVGEFFLLEDGSMHWSQLYPSSVKEIYDVCAAGDMIRYRFKVAESDTAFVAVHRFRDDRWFGSLKFHGSGSTFLWLYLLRSNRSCDVYVYEDSFTHSGGGLFLTGHRLSQFASRYEGSYQCEVIRHRGDGIEFEPLTTLSISQPGDHFLRIFDADILHATVSGDTELSWGEDPPRYPCLPMPKNICSADLRFSDGCEPNAHFPDGHKGKLFEGTLTKDGCTHLVRGTKL